MVPVDVWICLLELSTGIFGRISWCWWDCLGWLWFWWLLWIKGRWCDAWTFCVWIGVGAWIIVIVGTEPAGELSMRNCRIVCPFHIQRVVFRHTVSWIFTWGMILNDRSPLNWLFMLRHLIADMICDWHYRWDLSRTDTVGITAVMAADDCLWFWAFL